MVQVRQSCRPIVTKVEESLLEVARLRLPDLPDVEVDEVVSMWYATKAN